MFGWGSKTTKPNKQSTKLSESTGLAFPNFDDEPNVEFREEDLNDPGLLVNINLIKLLTC